MALPIGLANARVGVAAYKIVAVLKAINHREHRVHEEELSKLLPKLLTRKDGYTGHARV